TLSIATTLPTQKHLSTLSDECPPKDFCVNKADGGYANPSDKSQFFYCQNHLASQCLWCAPMLIFNKECCRCLYLNQGCNNSAITTTLGIVTTTRTITTKTLANITTKATNLAKETVPETPNQCPPKDFCVNKADGGYANPSDKSQFFYCQNHLASQCLWCAPMLIFNQECCRCLYLNQDCKGKLMTTTATTKSSEPTTSTMSTTTTTSSTTRLIITTTTTPLTTRNTTQPTTTSIPTEDE
uniref:Uncharacterized protein n=2 Tax=Clytia hemisphaerica TaxID=252671 RepID=A0A7M5WJW7_9CNID